MRAGSVRGMKQDAPGSLCVFLVPCIDTLHNLYLPDTEVETEALITQVI